MGKTVVDHQVDSCYHCGTPVDSDPIQFDDKAFCCSGCKTVYQILSKNNLCEYYDLNNSPGKAITKEIRSNQFDCLDLPEVAAKYIFYEEGRQARAVFHLPHIHCSSCLWLLEKLPSLQPGIIGSRVLFHRKEIHVTYDSQRISLKAVAALLAGVGYEPYLPLEGARHYDGNKAQKQRIIRMGVAGFCLGNIMLLSFPEYLSISPASYGGELTYWFRYLSLLLGLPVFFYSAMEFFKPAWQSLRKGFLTIDAPVALAIVICFLRSIVDIVGNTGSGYLDSMTGIVFLMLVGRILQNRTQQALTFDRDYTSYFPVAAHKLEGGEEKPVMLTHLKAGDTIKVYGHEIIPADAILSRGTALIDYSFVTGESVPVSKHIGDLIYAGGRQTAGSLELLLVKDVSKSYLTGLWNQASEKGEKDDADSFIHPLAKYFTLVLLVLVAITGVYWYWHNPTLVWPVVTAMLIVACPCALLLSATFTYGHMVVALDKFGFYLRNHAILEKLMKVKHFVFDKTGTITNNEGYSIIKGGDQLTSTEESWLHAMASQSSHPLSRALSHYLSGNPLLQLDNVHELEGKGVEAWIEDRLVRLGSRSFARLENQEYPLNSSVVGWNIDSGKSGWFALQAKYRPGVVGMLRKMFNKYRITVLSGDDEANTDAVKKVLGNDLDIRLSQLPHAKMKFVKEAVSRGEKIAMIGDGLNDSGALQNAYVGIAVTDNINNFSPASDAILEAEKISSLMRIISFIHQGHWVIKFSFTISVLYNIVGLWFAATGQLSPLVAAILMPASSISIIVITWLGVWLSAKKMLVKR